MSAVGDDGSICTNLCGKKSLIVDATMDACQAEFSWTLEVVASGNGERWIYYQHNIKTGAARKAEGVLKGPFFCTGLSQLTHFNQFTVKKMGKRPETNVVQTWWICPDGLICIYLASRQTATKSWLETPSARAGEPSPPNFKFSVQRAETETRTSPVDPWKPWILGAKMA
jgi:hypothetical protein